MFNVVEDCKLQGMNNLLNPKTDMSKLHKLLHNGYKLKEV